MLEKKEGQQLDRTKTGNNSLVNRRAGQGKKMIRVWQQKLSVKIHRGRKLDKNDKNSFQFGPYRQKATEVN